MLRTLTILSAIAFAAPAIAQSTPPADQSATPAPAPAAPAPDLASAVAADWPKYDQGGKGHLTKDEFGNWLTALRAQGGASGDDPAKVKAWADESFVKADVDANAQVTPEEMTAFLQTKVKR